MYLYGADHRSTNIYHIQTLLFMNYMSLSTRRCLIRQKHSMRSCKTTYLQNDSPDIVMQNVQLKSKNIPCKVNIP